LEAELNAADTPRTRKVLLRSAMVMSIDKGGVYDQLATVTRRGLGGAIAGGKQYVSWIHELDFCRAVEFLIEHENLSGPVNLAAPNPLPHKEFMRQLRKALGVPIGVPATAWMMEIACKLMGTDSELLLKSRRVIPTRLLDAGFDFRFVNWQEACRDLASRNQIVKT
jgi:NAD dependent epimerase/dehydratase family enzyme